jgi:N-terminal domain on NACHT_NTPase and P-loop NTPases
MAGVEVLGALAAASQLAEQGLRIAVFISELYVKVRDAPESIRRQSIQIQQLIDIAKLIEHTPPLQTTSVESILRNCVGEAEKLQEILGKVSTAAGDGRVKKMWKALDVVAKEKMINILFTRLEREKSSLVLCIETIGS